MEDVCHLLFIKSAILQLIDGHNLQKDLWVTQYSGVIINTSTLKGQEMIGQIWGTLISDETTSTFRFSFLFTTVFHLETIIYSDHDCTVCHRFVRKGSALWNTNYVRVEKCHLIMAVLYTCFNMIESYLSNGSWWMSQWLWCMNDTVNSNQLMQVWLKCSA